MMGFAFSLIGELLTGKGALAQLGYEVFDDKLGIVQIDELVIGKWRWHVGEVVVTAMHALHDHLHDMTVLQYTSAASGSGVYAVASGRI